MSIDPLKSSLVPLPGTAKNPGPKAATTQIDFAELLKTAQQPEAPINPVAIQAQAMLELARMQLLQGLFAEHEEPAKQGTLLDSLRLNTSRYHARGQSQQVDNLYRRMQPSVREESVPSRSEIEQMIDKVAEQVSLAPELIRSVVTAESDFQSQAVSHAGAQGLMQLMPETAKELGVDNSFDPHQNLLGGSRYLKQLFEKYDGDLDKTLAAYNWGQGNVDRKGLAEMPEETRNYLAKVKGMLSGKA